MGGLSVFISPMVFTTRSWSTPRDGCDTSETENNRSVTDNSSEAEVQEVEDEIEIVLFLVCKM